MKVVRIPVNKKEPAMDCDTRVALSDALRAFKDVKVAIKSMEAGNSKEIGAALAYLKLAKKQVKKAAQRRSFTDE